MFHQPLYGVDSYRAKSKKLVRRLSSESGLPVKSFDCNGGCHGTFTDWLNRGPAGRAVTIEFNSSPTNWRLDKVTRAVLIVSWHLSPQFCRTWVPT